VYVEQHQSADLMVGLQQAPGERAEQAEGHIGEVADGAAEVVAAEHEETRIL
jgi:hypothetical protein